MVVVSGYVTWGYVSDLETYGGDGAEWSSVSASVIWSDCTCSSGVDSAA